MDTKANSPAQVADALRKAMRNWASGVTVVTALYEGRAHGMTVSSFTSVSLDPPMVIVSLQTASRTHDVVMKAGAFGVSILSAAQQTLSERFASHMVSMDERLEGLETEPLITGAPLIQGSLAQLDCRVSSTISVGMNTVFLAEVVGVRAAGHGTPLVYHDRKYHALQ